MQVTQEWKPLPGYVDFSTDPYEFDLHEYLERAIPDPEMLKYPETRRELTKANPLLFALLYLSNHLKTPQGDRTPFSLFHLQLYKWASGTWHQPSGIKNARDAFIAPRGAAKTTMVTLLLPMWAACHKFIHFIAAYSDSESTIQKHLNTFRDELKNNSLIKEDYPHMFMGRQTWTKEESSQDENGQEVKDQALFLKTGGGFVFAAKSISSNSLGLKIGARRPDCLILDDVERQAGDYSALQAEKRRQSIIGGILGQSKPMGARVLLIGTNLMIDSMIDGMIKYARGDEAPPWIEEENFKVHWFRPFIRRADGTKESMWPGVWETSFLLEEEGKESFAVDFDCQPVAKGGAFWRSEDFEIGSIPVEHVSFGILSLDPAVSSTRKSDFSAFAVVLYSRSLDRYELVYTHQAKLTPAQIRQRVESLCSSYPQITTVYVETNQGGDVWEELLKGIPVRVKSEKATVSKDMRAEWALQVYQTIKEDGSRRIVHRTRFPELEQQMKAFPNVPNDDLVDCVDQAIIIVERGLREDRKGKGRRKLLAGSKRR